MPPEKKFNLDDFIVTMNGEVVGDFKSTTMNHVSITHPEEVEVKDGDVLSLFNKDFTITLKDIELSEEFANTLMSDGLYTVVGTGYKFPRGNKFPKKKRLRKKWMKKYAHEFVLENCVLGSKSFDKNSIL